MEVDVSRLLAEIQQRLFKKHHQGESKHPNLVSEYRLLRRLKSQLGPERKRLSRRMPGEFEVDVIAGLQEVHHFLTDDQRTDPAAPPGAQTAAARGKQARPGHRIDYNVVLNLELVQLEGPEQSANANAGRVPPRPPIRRARCRTLNFSVGGYCLATEPVERFHLQVGEFVALREGNSDRWLPATVSWAFSNGGLVQFGVNLMAPYFSPGKALCRRGNRVDAAHCLLLFDNEYDTPSKILMTPDCRVRKSRLSVEYGDNRLGVVLKKALAKTHGFVEYLCAEAEPGVGEEASDALDLLAGDSEPSEPADWPWKRN
jgi:hypothetical protein